MAWDVCDQFLTWGSPDHRNLLGTWRLQLHHFVAPGSWILSVPADKDSILPVLGHLLLNGLCNCFLVVHIWQWWFIVCCWWQLLVRPARAPSRTYDALLPTVVAVIDHWIPHTDEAKWDQAAARQSLWCYIVVCLILQLLNNQYVLFLLYNNLIWHKFPVAHQDLNQLIKLYLVPLPCLPGMQGTSRQIFYLT